MNFLTPAAYDAASSLVRLKAPEASPVGITLAALVMAPIIAKEGVEALRGEQGCGDGACH